MFIEGKIPTAKAVLEDKLRHTIRGLRVLLKTSKINIIMKIWS